MIWKPLMIKCTNSCCGWLASLFHLCLHESINVRIPLEISWLALFWVLLAFLDQPFWLLQLCISNVPPFKYHTWFTYKRRQAPTLGRSDLSPKNHSWHSLEITWLIDPSDRLNLMNNLKSFLSPFLSNCLSSFLSTKWFPIVTRT